MAEERRICAKQILDRVIEAIYKGMFYFIVIAVILCIGFFFLYPHYQKYAYMKNCLQTGYQKDWCEKTWVELLELD